MAPMKYTEQDLGKEHEVLCSTLKDKNQQKTKRLLLFVTKKLKKNLAQQLFLNTLLNSVFLSYKDKLNMWLIFPGAPAGK